MLAELLQGIGTLTVFIVGGAWLLRRHEERKDAEYIESQLRWLRKELEEHPERREDILQRMRAVNEERMPRVGIFEDPTRRRR